VRRGVGATLASDGSSKSCERRTGVTPTRCILELRDMRLAFLSLERTISIDDLSNGPRSSHVIPGDPTESMRRFWVSHTGIEQQFTSEKSCSFIYLACETSPFSNEIEAQEARSVKSKAREENPPRAQKRMAVKMCYWHSTGRIEQSSIVERRLCYWTARVPCLARRRLRPGLPIQTIGAWKHGSHFHGSEIDSPPCFS
jgi:hypothetical protein